MPMSADQVPPLHALATMTLGEQASAQPRSNTFWQSFARSQVLRVLRELREGELEIRDQKQQILCGAPAEDGLKTGIRILDPQVFPRMLAEGSLGAAEAYIRGEWEADDLVAFFRLMCRNMDRLTRLESGMARLGNGLARLVHRWSDNSRTGSRKNIAAHYDLSNEFFQLFLDPTLMYSSAYFADPQMSLEEASLAKIDRACQKLNLQPGDHLLEIGTGWGGLAVHAVREYGCRVTTTTISRQQHAYAQERFRREGVADRITLLDQDYRDLSGHYDKLISIEMIEAVGADYLPGFLAKCESLLNAGGAMLIQSILMPDHRYARYCRSVDFIQKYIFPGGHLPSVAALQQGLSETTRLRLAGFEEFGQSYAITLNRWRQAFHENLSRLQPLGFDERFIRMWDYYFCYCEAAFLEQATSVAQFVWTKSRY